MSVKVRVAACTRIFRNARTDGTRRRGAGTFGGTGDFPGITLDLGDRWLDKIAASAAPSHSRIWDSYPKVRFAPDFPLEGGGFEPSVPLSRHPSAQCSGTRCCGVGL